MNALDRGLHYGDGLFETMAVRGGRPLLWAEHMARLALGCTKLGIPVPSERQLAMETKAVCDGLGEAVVKVIVTRGPGARGYRVPDPVTPTRIVMASPRPAYPERNVTEGVSVRICTTRLACNPVLAGIKHLNRLEQIMARREWNDESVAEGLMLDMDDNVVEGIMSNVFLVKDGTMTTPDLSRCGVAGIMRGRIINLAKELQLPLVIRTVTLAMVREADELFLTNSLVGIWPIRQVEQQSFQAGPVARRLVQVLHARGEA